MDTNGIIRAPMLIVIALTHIEYDKTIFFVIYGVINIPIKLENKLIDVISPISDLFAPIVFRNTGKNPNSIEKVTN